MNPKPCLNAMTVNVNLTEKDKTQQEKTSRMIKP